MKKYTRRSAILPILGLPLLVIPKAPKENVMYHGVDGGMTVQESYKKLFDTIDNHSDVLNKLLDR